MSEGFKYKGSWEEDYLKRIYAQRKKPFPQKKSSPKKEDGGHWPFSIISAAILMMSLAVLLGFSLAIFSRFLLFETLLTLMPGEKLLPETTLLVLGLDRGKNIHRSDTIMVVHMDPKNNTASVVSIPRDTLVNIPGIGPNKANAAYAYGGPELSRATLENFLGIKIPYYVSLDIDAMANLIDDIGGIKINVEKRMYYIDRAQNLFVDLKPGRQTLKGRDALSYVRYRQDGGDITRILRQQKFLKALANQISSKKNIVRSPQILLKFFSYMDTNLNTKEIVGLALSMKKIYDLGEIRMTRVKGYDAMINGIYFIRPDDEALKRTVKDYLKGG